MLKAIEQATGRPIAKSKAQTDIADLQAESPGADARRPPSDRAGRRLLDAFQAMVEPLGDEFGDPGVALAAVKLAPRRDRKAAH